MFTEFMLICLVISIIVNFAYSFAAETKVRYTLLANLIMNLLGALVGFGLVLEHGRTVIGVVIVFANGILVGFSLGKLLLKDLADKTEERK